MTKFMINKTAVREQLSQKDMQLGKDLAEKVEENARKEIQKGIQRALANGRKTVFPKDL